MSRAAAVARLAPPHYPCPCGIVRAAAAALVVLAGATALGCGRKGPPLAPLARTPAAVEDIDARRLGDDVFLSFTVPARDVDASTPASLSRIDVLALTASEPPSPAEFLRDAARVVSVAVALDAPDGPAPPTTAGATQGERITVRDVLEPVTEPLDDAGGPGLRRFYLAVGVSERERSNPSGRLVSVPAGPPPEPPQRLMATHTAESIRLEWAAPAGDVTYNVYAETGDPSAAEQAGAAARAGVTAPPRPLNAMPLTDPAFVESIGAFGAERCYRVRSVRTADGAASIESAPSARECITPVDRFAPDAPTGVAAVAGPDGVALIWDPNSEPDLAGYLILRGTPADVTLLPVTSMPVVATQYLDRDVVPGMRYVYAVVAVDSREPPNVSEESPRVAATAR